MCLDSEIAYFMQHGKNPPPRERKRKYIPPDEDSFDLLNYLETNFETGMSNAYKWVKGYY